MVGMSIARRMRSGTGVGPGICRKCRPAVREEFFAMEVFPDSRVSLSPSRTNAICSQAYNLSARTGRGTRTRRMAAQAMPGLERRLKAEVRGDVLFDRFSRGRYATDASHYQMMPVGVVAPRTTDDAVRAIALARAEGVTVLPRGGGTSQAGQTVNSSLVVDCSKHLTRVLELDVPGRRCVVEPGIVLDDLNRALKVHGCGFRWTC